MVPRAALSRAGRRQARGARGVGLRVGGPGRRARRHEPSPLWAARGAEPARVQGRDLPLASQVPRRGRIPGRAHRETAPVRERRPRRARRRVRLLRHRAGLLPLGAASLPSLLLGINLCLVTVVNQPDDNHFRYSQRRTTASFPPATSARHVPRFQPCRRAQHPGFSPGKGCCAAPSGSEAGTRAPPQEAGSPDTVGAIRAALALRLAAGLPPGCVEVARSPARTLNGTTGQKTWSKDLVKRPGQNRSKRARGASRAARCRPPRTRSRGG